MSGPVPRPLVGAAVPASTRRAPVWVLSIFVFGAIGYFLLFVQAFLASDGEMLQGLIIAPILVGLTIPFALRLARSEGDPQYFPLVMAALVAKLGAALVRYYISFVVYHGLTDAQQYDQAGAQLAPQLRRFIFPNTATLVGTNFIKLLTGIVYAIFGTSRIAGGFAFAWIGFLGLLMMVRAFRVAIPDGAFRRYTILVLFLPSLMYWPSAIGKEAWMMLCLGAAALGVALMFRSRSGGLVYFILGVAGLLMVRPHMALIVFAGLVFAFALRKAPGRSMATPIFRILGLVVVVVLGAFLASRTASFLKQDAFTTNTISSALTSTVGQTQEGGSSFSPVIIHTPLDVGPAFATVFFRPFPFEAGSSQELVTAAECSFLLGLMFFSWNRLRSIPKLIRTTPYVAYCVGYCAAFTFAFSSFANFGILARQRTQALPFLLVLFALPRVQDLLAGTEPETETTLQVVRDQAPPPPPPPVPAYGPLHRTRRPVRSETLDDGHPSRRTRRLDDVPKS
ncbi:MAG: hypothetical protein WCI50_07710 [Actinomycetes bacterium]